MVIIVTLKGWPLMSNSIAILCAVIWLTATAATIANEDSTQPQENEQNTYSQNTVLAEAESFFGKGAQGIAQVIEKAFKDLGRPTGYIRGEEAAAAFIVGLRYGNGDLNLKSKGSRLIHWQGPSIGFDAGGNAAKVFVLVYNLPDIEKIYKRFPGVDGSLYIVGGLGLNYVQHGNTILAPIRLGVGWRAGANVGYMKVTKHKTWNPF